MIQEQVQVPLLLARAATNWTPGLVVLGLGVALTVVVLLVSKKKAPPGAVDQTLADLETRLGTLLDQLRALEAERHQLGAGFDAEKTRLEREAAAAMRARDEHQRGRSAAAAKAAVGGAQASSGAAVAARAGAPEKRPLIPAQLQGALWGAGTVLFFVAVGWALQNWQGEREEGGVMTGRTPPGGMPPGAQAPSQTTPGFEEALARARADPRDVEAASFAVHELIRLQRFEEAERLTRQSLTVDPFHLETRIHLAVLDASRGEFRPALEKLGQLADTYPEAHEALLFRGALAMQVGESRMALESFERFVAEAPADEQPPQLQSAISMLRQQVGQ